MVILRTKMVISIPAYPFFFLGAFQLILYNRKITHDQEYNNSHKDKVKKRTQLKNNKVQSLVT